MDECALDECALDTAALPTPADTTQASTPVSSSYCAGEEIYAYHRGRSINFATISSDAQAMSGARGSHDWSCKR